MNTKNNLIFSALALALTFLLSPLARAQAQESSPTVESATSTPLWVCSVMGARENHELMCGTICDAGIATNPDGDDVLRWRCPNSDARKRCSSYDCSSASECEAKGVTDYASCHGNDEAECARQAQAATNALCVPPSGS